MKYHPAISIFLGLMAVFILYLISLYNSWFISFSWFILLFGGFIATFLAKVKKIRYGVYLGIILILILLLSALLVLHSNDYYSYLSFIVRVLFYTSFGAFLGAMTEKNNRIIFKNRINKMRFHPVISIILGFLVFLVLFYMPLFAFGGHSWFGDVLSFSSFIIGGFTASYFSINRKIEYGLFIGIPSIVFFLIFSTTHLTYNEIYITINILLLTLVGGFIGKIIDKNLWNNGINPIFAIIFGIIVGYVCNIFLQNFYHSFVSDVLFGMISIVIGAAITTFLAEEKKIQYGIYFALILMTFWILPVLYLEINSLANKLLIDLVASICYILSAIAGSYLGIKAAKYLNKQLN